MGIKSLPAIMTVKELAEILKINEQTVTRAIKRGDLKALKIGAVYRLKKEDVNKWIDKSG